MRSVKGNKTVELSPSEVREIAGKYPRVHIDLGTGDGRFIYESALKDGTTLFIGIDPAEKQLREYSVKSVKKKLKNTLFLVSPIETLPEEFAEIADTVTIILPWGSLLGGIVRAEETTISKITSLLRLNGILQIVLGYSPELEPSQSERLLLPELSEKYIENTTIKAFQTGREGLECVEKMTYPKEKLGSIGSSWAKKLSFGKNRQIYTLSFKLTS